MMKAWSILALACLCWTSVIAAPVAVVDSVERSYIQIGEPFPASAASLSTVVAALTGYLSTSSDTFDNTISHIVRPNPFKKPKAFVFLNVLGLFSVEEISLEDRAVRHLVVDAKDSTSTVLVEALSTIEDSNSDLQITRLGDSMIQDCSASCLENELVTIVEAGHGSYSASDEPLHGRINFRDLSLDLSQQDNRLLALEVATSRALALQELKRLNQGVQDVEVFLATISSLKTLLQQHGEESAEYQAGKLLLNAFILTTIQDFDRALDGDVIYQISCLGLEAEASNLESLQRSSGRRSLQSTDDEMTQARTFSVKATGYGSFVLLVYFTLASLYCMCFMPFKQDTLLYAKTKGE